MKLNTKYVLDFAKEILEIPSPTGFTKNVMKRIEEEVNKYNLEFEYTKKGNMIISFDGENKEHSIGFAAHVDTLGAMIRSIGSNGVIKFTTLGGPIWNTLDGEYCKIHTKGNKVYEGTFLSNSPASHVFKDANTLSRNESNMYVRLDEVVKTKKDVLDLGIDNGDFISFETKTRVLKSGYVKSRFLDDKICVAILFGFIDYLNTNNITPKSNLKFIISTYEEVGHGSSYIPELNEFISVDMGCIGLDLMCTEQDVSICAKDSSGPYDYDIVSKMKKLAVENKINHAVDIYPFYGSDTSAALRAGNDIKGGLIGPGVHASHGMERTHIDGINATINLLINYIK